MILHMETIETLCVTNRKDWRKWLAKHHRNKKEVWLIYYRKGSGKTRISYDDAVLEALCYGWIDGKIKGIDNQRYAQRFSPRKYNDILKLLKKDKQTWQNFQNFPESYKRIRIAYILTRKKHGIEMYEKSLQNFIRMTAKNKRIGFVKEWRNK